MFDFYAACRLNLFVESKKLFVSLLTLQRDTACARLISTTTKKKPFIASLFFFLSSKNESTF